MGGGVVGHTRKCQQGQSVRNGKAGAVANQVRNLTTQLGE